MIRLMNQKGFSSFILILFLVVIIGAFIVINASHREKFAPKLESIPKPSVQIVDLPQDLPRDIFVRVLYSKVEVKTGNLPDFTGYRFSYPQLLDFKDKNFSDKFNNASFIKPFYSEAVLAWSPDGTQFVNEGNIQPTRLDYAPDKEHNDSEYEGRFYLYEIQKLKEAFSQNKSYEPKLLKSISGLNITVENLVWSPDNKKVAYWVSNEDRHYETATNITTYKLVMLDISTGEEKVILAASDPGKYMLADPKWSPDSTKILFSEREQINDNSQSNNLKIVDVNSLEIDTVIKADNGENAISANNIYYFDWINDKEILINKENRAVFIYNLDTLKERQVINRPMGDHLSPDKKKMISYAGDGTSKFIVVDLEKGLGWPKITTTDKNVALSQRDEFIKNNPDFVELPEGYSFSALYGVDPIQWIKDGKYLLLTFSKTNPVTSIVSDSVWLLDIANQKFVKIPQLENVSNPRLGF